MLKILITGCGSEGALGVIKSLKCAYGEDVYILGMDTDQYNANQAFLDKFIIPPMRTDSGFLKFIIDKTNEYNIDVIWPIPTMELELFAASKAMLEGKTRAKVMIGELAGLAIANNKIKLYQVVHSFLPECVPDFAVISSKDEMKKAVFELGYPYQKVCIKKEQGAGTQGFRILDANISAIDLLFNHIAGPTCLWADIENALSNVINIPKCMITEYLPGEEWDCDVLCLEGKVYSMVTRLNLRMAGGMARVTHIKKNTWVEKYSEIIIKNLKLSYIINIAFKKDAHGNLKILEINPRVPGTIIAALFAGVNLVKQAIDILFENYPQPFYLTQNANILISRYWDERIINIVENNLNS